MADTYFDELRTELFKGISEEGHPFRYGTLATVGLDRMARLRTVVIRAMSDDFIFSIFTDRRSKKIVHIKENNKVSLLFFHPQKMMQLKVEGLAIINKDASLLKTLWKGINKTARKDYTTARAPGSTLDNLADLEYLKEEDYFCLLEVHPFKIEYLKLQKTDNLRIRFSKKETGWKSEYLVP